MGRPLSPAPPVSPSNTLGERIRRARVSRGFSQTALGEMIGKGQSVVASYEAGHVDLAAGLVPVIAEKLGTTVAALYGEAPDPAVGLIDTPTRHLLVDVDISDLSQDDRMEVQALVALLVTLRRRRQRTQNPDGF